MDQELQTVCLERLRRLLAQFNIDDPLSLERKIDLSDIANGTFVGMLNCADGNDAVQFIIASLIAAYRMGKHDALAIPDAFLEE